MPRTYIVSVFSLIMQENKFSEKKTGGTGRIMAQGHGPREAKQKARSTRLEGGRLPPATRLPPPQRSPVLRYNSQGY
jgi:hypothetical protein